MCAVSSMICVIIYFNYLLRDLYLGLTFMAVNPKYQRQGVGSMMMEQICKEVDQRRQYAYVLAAPEGVRLYSKFGFSIVGSVETPQGAITSMLRQPQQSTEAKQLSKKNSKLKKQ